MILNWDRLLRDIYESVYTTYPDIERAVSQFGKLNKDDDLILFECKPELSIDEKALCERMLSYCKLNLSEWSNDSDSDSEYNIEYETLKRCIVLLEGMLGGTPLEDKSKNEFVDYFKEEHQARINHFVNILKSKKIMAVNETGSFIEKKGHSSTKKTIVIWYHVLKNSHILIDDHYRSEFLEVCTKEFSGFAISKQTASKYNEHPKYKEVLLEIETRVKQVIKH